ncbi:hypothetical protein [Nonomuraea insulae]|uniref:Secreted protein n=1 Tax=Nonomuraea insulae TaxID=1616787 RepID=A0ABW1C9I5_9ACTN
MIVAAGVITMLALLGGAASEEAAPPPEQAASAPNALKTFPWTRGVDPSLPHTLVVGVDIEPGTYTTKGSDRSPNSCSWYRLSELSGEAGSVIDSGTTVGPVTVTILPTDKGFVTEACKEWVGPG